MRFSLMLSSCLLSKHLSFSVVYCDYVLMFHLSDVLLILFCKCIFMCCCGLLKKPGEHTVVRDVAHPKQQSQCLIKWKRHYYVKKNHLYLIIFNTVCVLSHASHLLFTRRCCSTQINPTRAYLFQEDRKVYHILSKHDTPFCVNCVPN